MSLLSLASAGCRQLVSAVDAVASLLSLVLRLNNALAAQLVWLLSAAAAHLLQLLDQLAAAVGILLKDLAAFLADIGDAVAVVVDLTTCAVTEALLAVGRVLTALSNGVEEILKAVTWLYWTVSGSVAAVWTALTGLVLTGVSSVELMYQTVIYLLTMVPYGIVLGVQRCFSLLEGLVKGALFGCVSSCGAAADGMRRAVLGLVDGARSVPPAALLGAGVLLLTGLGLRRLARLISARGLPVRRLQTAAARLLALCRRVSAALIDRLRHRARPVAVRLLHLLDTSLRSASDGVRTAVAVCRLSVAVVIASAEITSRCLRTFVGNVALGLRLGAAGGRRAPAIPQEPDPQERRRDLRPWQPPEREPREPREPDPEDWEPERTPPPPVAPRRNLRSKTAAGCSLSASGAGDTSRVCVICLDKEKSVILLPCRHVCVCEPCGRTVGAGDRRCPMCREYIQDALKVYL